MKTEVNIAEENIKELVLWREGYGMDGKKLNREGYSKNLDWELISLSIQGEHKASCERDVPKLKKIKESVVYVENELVHHLLDELILDKEQAIKLYNEVGI